MKPSNLSSTAAEENEKIFNLMLLSSEEEPHHSCKTLPLRAILLRFQIHFIHFRSAEAHLKIIYSLLKIIAHLAKNTAFSLKTKVISLMALQCKKQLRTNHEIFRKASNYCQKTQNDKIFGKCFFQYEIMVGNS